MNKKLLKALLSITCGLGIVGTIPTIASSCGCSNKIEYRCRLSQLSGSLSSITTQGDYIDFKIDEPVGKGAKSRKNNYHQVSFKILCGKTWDQISKYFADDFDPYSSDTKYNGLHFDEKSNFWHFGFKISDNLKDRFKVRLQISNTIDGIVSVSSMYTLNFHPEEESGKVEVGLVEDYSFYFNNEKIKDIKQEYGSDQAYRIHLAKDVFNVSSEINVGPNESSTAALNEWRNYVDDLLNNPTDKTFFNTNRSNFLAYVTTVEAFNAAWRIHEHTIENDSLTVLDYTNDGEWVNKQTITDASQLEDIAFSIDISSISNKGDTRGNMLTDLTFTVLKDSTDQEFEGVSLPRTDGDDDEWHGKDEKFYSLAVTSGLSGLYLESSIHDEQHDGWISKAMVFGLCFSGDVKYEIPSSSEIPSVQGCLQTITFGCVNLDGVKNFLETFFPKIPNIVVTK